jgi:MPBQ/MSBQ methyltransferase
MIKTDQNISKYYSVGDLGDQILTALKTAGKNLDALTIDDLKPIDAFHIRGRAATEELATWAEIKKGHKLLDVGSGLGGTGRYLANVYNCDVVGLDLTEEYCRVAEMLSARVGLSDRTEYKQGSALEMPFGDDKFDIVWTEHVQMNIEDKPAFYQEIKRVLKPGGQLVFHDIFSDVASALHFPVPWALDESMNHLIAVDEVRKILTGLGFTQLRWEEKTESSIVFFRAVLERLKKQGRPALGLHLLIGDDAETKFTNLLSNMEEGLVRVVQAGMLQSGT